MTVHTMDWDDLPAAVADADMVEVGRVLSLARAGAQVDGHKYKRRARFVAAVIAVQRHDFTTSMIMKRFNFSGKQARIIHHFAQLIDRVPEPGSCAVCGRKPRRIGRKCTWCWDTEERTKTAMGPPPSLDSSAVPSINQPR